MKRYSSFNLSFSFRRFFLPGLCMFLLNLESDAQPPVYTPQSVHAHNDYEGSFPFWQAWKEGLGSIEADVFLESGKLVVAHTKSEVSRGWTLDSLYLEPLKQCMRKGNARVYPDTARHLQLMIDIKTEAVPALSKLVEVLKGYPELTGSRSLSIVISGNRPAPDAFPDWPDWITFDGEVQKSYTPGQLSRIAMLSDNFKRYSSWNGKGRVPQKEWEALQKEVRKAHALGKKIRFWNAPDGLNSWYQFMELGVDWINTDQIAPISRFLNSLPATTYTNPDPHKPYTPQGRNDGADKPVKNVILLIGDGTGLAQWQAAATANKGFLNVFQMRRTGLSRTSSGDHYVTDSAPGATAFSAGIKTNNRSVGVDHTGKRVELLPQLLKKVGIQTGIITTGDLRDATPAAFYAHQPERSRYAAILQDLVNEPVAFIAGACPLQNGDSVRSALRQVFDVHASMDNLQVAGKRPVLVMDTLAALPVAKGREAWAGKAFERAAGILSKAGSGFLLVVEGAQIDHGGHAGNLPYAVSELLDFDRVIGRALQFADSNGETLVVVVGDHETGGLSLLAGSPETATVSGQFATDDHTAVPVPVFAYGPQSDRFTGVYENTEIFSKILEAFGKRGRRKKLGGVCFPGGPIQSLAPNAVLIRVAPVNGRGGDAITWKDSARTIRIAG